MIVENPMISVIIPTVNQVELVTQCLSYFYSNEPSIQYTYEVIVVDDGSSPEIQQNLRKALIDFPVRLLTKDENQGFSATVNHGVANSNGKFICLLNNDVTLNQKNWLDMMMRDAIRSQMGVVGPRLLYPDGQIQHGGIIYIPASGGFDHEYRGKPSNYPPALRTREVLGVTGALMLINRELWELLNGMDERFFVGMEDIDFCLRTWEVGWRICYTGSVSAIHPEGHTRGNDPYWKKKGLESCQKFMEKWYGKLLLLGGPGNVPENQLRVGQITGSISEEQAIRWQRITRKGKNIYNSYRSYKQPVTTFVAKNY